MYGCEHDVIEEGIDSGYTWMSPYRGACTINYISATLDRPEGPLECTRWHKTGCAAEG